MQKWESGEHDTIKPNYRRALEELFHIPFHELCEQARPFATCNHTAERLTLFTAALRAHCSDLSHLAEELNRFPAPHTNYTPATQPYIHDFYPEETIKQIRDMRENGSHVNLIAATTGVGQKTILRYTRDIPAPKYKPLTVEAVNQTRTVYARDPTLTVTELANLYGANPTLLAKALLGKTHGQATAPPVTSIRTEPGLTI